MNTPRCTSHKIKIVLKGILFTALLILFYFLYMKKALDQFIKGSTTIIHTQEMDEFPDQPVLIACTTPPFKQSFFKDHGLHNGHYTDFFKSNGFWMYDSFRKKFENDSSMLDVYMNMSYTALQTSKAQQNDWLIHILSIK